jgi:ligand-binding sensor domain-containing protein/signal transduction histidine kinase
LGFYSGALSTYDPKTKVFTEFTDKGKPLSTSGYTAITEDSDGDLWFASTSTGLIQYQPSKNSFSYFKHDPLKKESITINNLLIVTEYEKGKLAIGGENGGLILYDKRSGIFTNYRNDRLSPHSISYDVIYSLFVDSQNNIWIGTYEHGVNFLRSLKNKKFVPYKTFPGGPKITNNTVPRALIDKEDNFWIATDGGGLNYYNPKTSAHEVYTHNPFDPHSLSSDKVIDLCLTKDNNLWIGTYFGGLDLLNKNDGTFERFLINDSKHTYNVVIVEDDKKGNLWIGTHGEGVRVFNISRKEFTEQYTDMPADTNAYGITHNIINVIQFDHEGYVWIGTVGGLSRVELSTKKIRHLLPNTYFCCSFHDSNNNLWFGTPDGLLLITNHKALNGTLRYKTYTEEHGLPSSSICSIEEDNNKNLWISTTNGLSRFTPKTETFRNFDIHDGLQGQMYLRISSCKTPHGQLFFGGTNGFNLFHPDSILDDETLPTLVLTDFLLFNSSVPVGGLIDNRIILPQAINETKAIALSYKDDVFSISFAGLHYTTPEKNKYAYRLVGFDKQWNYATAQRRFATYTNLDAGSYTFQVKASNCDGIWSYDENRIPESNQTNNLKSLTIVIKPAWWTTWWFKILVLAFIIGSVALGVYLRIRAIKLNEIRLEEKLTERTSELVEIQKKALVNAHKAGKADVATEIVHNAGNVLTSIVTSLNLFDGTLKKNTIIQLEKAVKLIRKNRENLGEFFSTNPKAGPLADFIFQVTKVLKEDQNFLKKHTTRISEQVSHILGLIEDEKENLNVSSFKEKANIAALIDEVLLFNHHLFDKYNITIEKEFNISESVVTQQIKLSQVLNNLLSNAVDALDETPEKQGKIHLSCQKINDMVKITIDDNGKGIERDKLKLIFSHGFSTKTGHKGFGLHNTANYLTEMGGKIWAESEGPGKGAKFVIELKDAP